MAGRGEDRRTQRIGHGKRLGHELDGEAPEEHGERRRTNTARVIRLRSCRTTAWMVASRRNGSVEAHRSSTRRRTLCRTRCRGVSTSAWSAGRIDAANTTSVSRSITCSALYAKWVCPLFIFAMRLPGGLETHPRSTRACLSACDRSGEALRPSGFRRLRAVHRRRRYSFQSSPGRGGRSTSSRRWLPGKSNRRPPSCPAAALSPPTIARPTGRRPCELPAAGGRGRASGSNGRRVLHERDAEDSRSERLSAQGDAMPRCEPRPLK